MYNSPIVLFAAYGRRYSSNDAILKAWRAGRDFAYGMSNGPYTSIRDIRDLSNGASSIWLSSPQDNVMVQAEINKGWV